MARNIVTGENLECELVAPIKILVKPGFKDDETTSSLRRRSITSIEVPSGSDHGGGGGHETGDIFLVSQVEKRGRQREAPTRIQDGGGEKKNVAYYLQHCFRLMYFTGISTYNPDTEKKGEGVRVEKTWTGSVLNGFQKVIFWTNTFLSLTFAILIAKLNVLIFLWDAGALRFVYVGSWFFAIVSEIYFVYLFAYSHKRIKEATETMNDLGNYTIEEVRLGQKKWKCRNPRKLITVIFAATILACFVHPMGGSGVRGWTPKKLILDSSKQLSYQLFIWNPDDFDDNSTKIECLKQDYGTHLTPLTIIMGMSEIGMQFCSSMKMDTAQNMGVVVAVLAWLRNRYFGRKVKNINVENYMNGYDRGELENPNGLFAEFKRVKKENRQMNGLTGGLLKIVHAHNLLQCATFLMRCMDGEASLTEFAFLMYGLVKVTAIYYFAKKAEAENEVYEEWIREWAMHSTDTVFLARVPAILDGMTKGPLGVGRGNFMVGQGFIFRFIGFVGSIFMLEVDDDDDGEDN